MILIKKFFNKSRTSSGGSSWSDTHSVNDMSVVMAPGCRRRDSGVFDDSASLCSFSEPSSPPFVIGGSYTSHDGDGEVVASYVASRPRKGSNIPFRRTGSNASRKSMPSDSSSKNGDGGFSADPAGKISLPTIISTGGPSSTRLPTVRPPSNNLSSDNISQTGNTVLRRTDIKASSGPADPNRTAEMPVVLRRSSAFTDDCGVAGSTAGNTIEAYKSTSTATESRNGPDSSEKHQLGRDGRMYAKKSWFGFLPLPNRYVQQPPPPKQPLVKGHRHHRSLDSSGFAVAATGDPSNTRPAVSPTETNSAKPAVAVVETKLPVRPPRRNRLRLSNRGRNESSTLDVDDFLSQPINFRHSIASDEMITAMFSVMDGYRNGNLSDESAGCDGSRTDDDVTPEVDSQSSTIGNASSVNSIEFDSAVDETRQLSQSPLSTASSMSASAGFHSDMSSRATCLSSSSSSSSSPTSFRSADDTLYGVQAAIVPPNVDIFEAAANVNLVDVDRRKSESPVSATTKSDSSLTLGRVSIEDCRPRRPVGDLLVKSDADSSQRQTDDDKQAFSDVTTARSTTCDTRSMTSTTTTTAATIVGGNGNFYTGSSFYIEPLKISSPSTSTTSTTTMTTAASNPSDEVCVSVRTSEDGTRTREDRPSPLHLHSSTTSDAMRPHFEPRAMDVFHCLHGTEQNTNVLVSSLASSQNIVQQIFQKESFDADHRLYRLVVRNSTLDTQATDFDDLRRLNSSFDAVDGSSRVELVRKKTVQIKVVCDVGAKRSRNLSLEIADDATAWDVIGSAIDQFKLEDPDAFRYALIRINKSAKEMVQVKDSETVADLKNDYFLLCRSEHLAKTRSDESPTPEITNTVSLPLGSSVVVDTQPDLVVVGSTSSSQQPPLRVQPNYRGSSFDYSPPSPSSPLSAAPTLPHSKSHGRLSVPNMNSHLLDRVSPSSKILGSAELITLQSRLRQLETESAARERYWTERMSVVQKSLERFKTLAFTTDLEKRSALLEAELSDVTADLKLQEQRVKQCQTHMSKHRESSVAVPEKLNEIERKLAEAMKLQSAAALDREKLLPLVALAQSENELRLQSTPNTNENKSESLYDVISTIKSRCYVFGLSVGQASLDRFRCGNDNAGFLVICDAKESSALQLGDRILELNGTPVYNMASRQFNELARSATMPCRLVVVRETNEEPTLLNDMCQWMEQFN